MGREGLVHLRSLTSLRFVAAMLVVAHHLAIRAQDGLGPLAHLADPGYVGVTFFFVLSGFVLTYSWDDRAPVRGFYRRRFARVYPLHLLFVLLAMAPFIQTHYLPALPAHLTLTQAWWTQDEVVWSFSSVSWSLSCEAFFYAVFPFVVPLLRRAAKPLRLAAVLFALGLGVGLVVELSSRQAALYLLHFPPFRLVEFVIGCLVALAMVRGWRPGLSLRSCWMLVAMSYLTVLVLPAAIGARLEDRWAACLLMAPSFAALLAVAARRDVTGQSSWLSRPAMVTLGQWSFALYVTHVPVAHVARALLGVPDLVPALMGCLAVVAISIVLSGALHMWFERPIERRLRGAAPRADDLEADSVPESGRGGAAVRPVALD